MRPGGWLVTVIGKRNKERTVGVPIGAAAFIRDWIELRGRDSGPLFFPVRKNGVIVPQDKPMTTKVGNNIGDRRLLAAGVEVLSTRPSGDEYDNPRGPPRPLPDRGLGRP